MKKLLLLAALMSGLALQAASTSMVIQPGVFTNLLWISPGSVVVKQIIVSASPTNIANVQFVDTPTNLLTNFEAAYTNFISYATNYVTTWTNYYGATNNTTNYQLVDVSNSVPAVTNNYNIPIALIAPTNGLVQTGIGLNYNFQLGLWVTNAAAPGSGPATITITYVK